MTKKWLITIVGLGVAMFLGWVGGSAVPLPLWSYSDCHRLGGSIQIRSGPGAPKDCVIRVSDY